MSRTRSHQYFWGFILILLGLMFLLQNLGFLDIGDTIRRYWPLILVLIGFKILLNRRPAFPGKREDQITGMASKMEHHRSSSASEAGTGNTYSSVFGDLRLNFHQQKIRQFSASTVFGDMELDFSQANLEDQAQLKLSGIFGDLNLRLPPGLWIQSQINYLAGSSQVFEQYHSGVLKNISYDSPGEKGKQPEVKIEVSLLFGDIQISS